MSTIPKKYTSAATNPAAACTWDSKAMTLMKDAKKPLFLMGGGVNIGRANETALTLAETTRIPVITTIMGKGSIPTSHELYVGNVGMHGCYAANRAISECDLLFSIGTRFNDRITGKIDEFAKNAKIVHVDIDAASISRNIQVDIPIVADAKDAMEAMLKHIKCCEHKEWLDEIADWKKEHPLDMDQNKGITPQKIVQCINEQFEEGIFVTDVGQHQMWITQYLEMDEKNSFSPPAAWAPWGMAFLHPWAPNLHTPGSLWYVFPVTEGCR